MWTRYTVAIGLMLAITNGCKTSSSSFAQGTKPPSSREKALAGFDTILASGNVYVRYKQSYESKMELSLATKDRRDYTLDVKDKVLTISCYTPPAQAGQIHVTVWSPSIKKVRVADRGYFNAFSVSLDSIEVEALNSGQASFTGECKELKVTVDGRGRYSGAAMDSEVASCRATGRGEARISASKKIDIYADRGCYVIYSGGAPDVKKSGEGSIVGFGR